MSNSKLKEALKQLPPDCNEKIVESIFISALFDYLGFAQNEIYPNFPTGNGADAADFSARKNNQDDIFLQTGNNPFLIVEVKGKNINLASPNYYHKTVQQLKRYLSPQAKNCRSAKWGIICNGEQIQLFRRHGKVIFPVTQLITLEENNVDQKIQQIKQLIYHPSRSISIAVYNNKGGVGKTTTVINMAATLITFQKKVLVVDFDHNQQDLTNILNIKPPETGLFTCLENYKSKTINEAICSYTCTFKNGNKLGFDIIAADPLFTTQNLQEISQRISKSRLRKILYPIRNNYDYIMIDVPPNWNLFSQIAISASDLVLFPTKHNNIASLKNAAIAMAKFLPEIGEQRRKIIDFEAHCFPDVEAPTPLPIFFNGESATEAQMGVAQKAIKEIIEKIKTKNALDLQPYFFPKFTGGKKNPEIFQIPNSAYITSASFAHRPAVYTSKTVLENYKTLVEEYLI